MNYEPDEQKIRELIATWIQATTDGDLERVLTLMAEDVVFLMPGRPPMRGRAAFAAAGASQGKMKFAATPAIQEIHVVGDFAWCWNHLSVQMTPLPAGSPLSLAGPILSVFRKESDGRWVLFRDANMLAAI